MAEAVNPVPLSTILLLRDSANRKARRKSANEIEVLHDGAPLWKIDF